MRERQILKKKSFSIAKLQFRLPKITILQRETARFLFIDRRFSNQTIVLAMDRDILLLDSSFAIAGYVPGVELL